MNSIGFVSEVDSSFIAVISISIAILIGVTVTMLWFVYRYHHTRHTDAKDIHGHVGLEVTWTIIPTFLVIGMFWFGFTGYQRMATIPDEGVKVDVTGRMWSWEFTYENGIKSNKLVVPAGQPVILSLHSNDVIHSFYIPEFRWKRDVVPGQYSYMAVTPTKTGAAHVFCAEYCGTQHSGMLATVKIDTPEEYAEFKNTLGKMPKGYTPEKWGEELFTKNGCTTCHGVGGSGEVGGAKSPGPKLAGLFAKGQEQMADGAMITVDENYVRESILRPNAKIVMNYNNVQMPVFVLKDDQIDAIIAYLKTLK